jgi:hypothetical protein
MTRPVRWINRSGSTMAGGRLLRGRVTSLAIAAIDGQSVALGLAASKPMGIGERPLSMIRWPSE